MTSQNVMPLVEQFFRTWPISHAVTFGSNDHSNPHRVSKRRCAISGSISRNESGHSLRYIPEPPKHPPPLLNVPLFLLP
jgi:hypothetical protein